jgi:hypothetical protein
MKRSKIQDPRSREDPISKLQTPTGGEQQSVPSWCLGFDVSLDLGAWILDLFPRLIPIRTDSKHPTIFLRCLGFDVSLDLGSWILDLFPPLLQFSLAI